MRDPITTPKLDPAQPSLGRLIGLPEVIRTVGVCKSSIYAMIRRGEFPKPVKPRPRCSRWFEQEVVDWIEVCKSARDVG
jgi:prophage regulatory protein